MPKKSKLPDNQITVYQTPDGKINIEVLYSNENIWISQKRMAELFGCTADNISLHLKNIFKENELDESATTEEFSVVQHEGSREVARNVLCYSLEAIIAVGYRVNSERGTQFRQWATAILQQYIHKGFALDSDRFKYGSRYSARFFDDLLEEIRDIRSSERMAYQKITDIYATSIDNSSKAEDTKQSPLGRIFKNRVKKRLFLSIIPFIFLLTTPSFSASPADTLPIFHHKFAIDPISLLGGAVGGNYECRISFNHGLAVEGMYQFPLLGNTSWAVGGQYRRYYSRQSFTGLFVNRVRLSSKFPTFDRLDTTTYTIDLSSMTIGLNWGKNWYIKKRFPLCFRIGAGYPVISDIHWKNGLEHPYASLLETTLRIATFIDSELTIGVSF